MEGNVIRLTILSKLPLQSGPSKQGNHWEKQSFVGETLDKYPKKVMFSFFGEAIAYNQLVVGQTYDVSVDVESRSYVGKDGIERWNTEVKGFKSELVNITPTVPQTPPHTQPVETQSPQSQMDAQAEAYFNNQPTPNPTATPTPSEDLPF